MKLKIELSSKSFNHVAYTVHVHMADLISSHDQTNFLI